jgi:hypothetical protein
MATWWSWWAEKAWLRKPLLPGPDSKYHPPPMLRAVLGVVLLVLLGCPVGCRRHSLHPAPAPAPPATQVINRFESRKLGIALDYPAGWVSRQSPDYVLMLVPALAGSSGQRSISLDVPGLPFHLPGMIPIGLVKDGYLDDLRKQFGPIEIQDQPAPAIPKAEARLVQSTYRVNGKSFVEKALLLIHGDRVYILRATGDAAGYPPTLAAYDAIVRSLTWIE